MRVVVHTLCLLFVVFSAFSANARQINFLTRQNGAYIQFDYAWSDMDGKTQTLQFQLPASDLQRGIAEFQSLDFDKAEAYAAEQAKKYLRKYPKVNYVKTNVGYSLRSIGVSRRQLEVIAEDVEKVRKEAYDKYVESHFYDYYNSPMGQTYLPDYRRIAQRYVRAMQPIGKAIRAATANMNARQKVNYILSFLQSIPYDTLQDRVSTNGAGFQTPYGLMLNNRGDCDTKTVAMAAIMRNVFPSVRVVIVHVPGHAFVGLGFRPYKGDLSLNLGGQSFVLAEPVGPAQSAIGHVSSESKAYLDSRVYSYQEL